MTAAVGMTAAEEARFINLCLFSMGIATLIQTTVGNRLPIVQGPSATLTGTLVPVAGQLGAGAMWGGVLVGGLVEMGVGAARLLSALRRLFPPAVSGAVVVAIALALGEVAVRLSVGDGSGRSFLLAGLVIALVFLLQVPLRRIGGGILARGAIFFSIWIVGLGVGGAMGEVDWGLVADREWLALPDLFPWGGPGFGWEFPLAAVLAVLAGYFGSMVESLGDYAATCAVAGERFTVRHMNRGILAEGEGSVVAAVLGGLPCTSYTQNVGIIATTRVASRFVVQVAAGFLLLYGLSPRFGALLVAMPRPVLGGVFLIVCGMIAVSGVRLLGVAGETTAHRLVVGTTLVVSVALPVYTRFGLGEAWLDGLPALLRLSVTNPVVLAVLLGVGLNLLLVVLPGEEEGEETGRL